MVSLILISFQSSFVSSSHDHSQSAGNFPPVSLFLFLVLLLMPAADHPGVFQSTNYQHQKITTNVRVGATHGITKLGLINLSSFSLSPSTVSSETVLPFASSGSLTALRAINLFNGTYTLENIHASQILTKSSGTMRRDLVNAWLIARKPAMASWKMKMPSITR